MNYARPLGLPGSADRATGRWREARESSTALGTAGAAGRTVGSLEGWRGCQVEACR